MIYNKALFRNATLVELKNELEERNISWNPSDSYYLLTLKVRVDILHKTKTFHETRKAMEEEMRADEDIFIMGEEVAEYQGAYKVTRELLQEFGEKRHIAQGGDIGGVRGQSGQDVVLIVAKG